MQTGIPIPGPDDAGAAGDVAGTDGPALTYRLCPRCLRAVPTSSVERYCVNDGTRLLDGCPGCHSPITSPYTRHCGRCGRALSAPLDGACGPHPG